MKTDPVKHCPVYKNEGCSHVDGYLCDFPHCSIVKSYNLKHYPIEGKLLTIAFDFDGVIHKYRKGWQDGSIYDELNINILNLINQLLNEGHCVFIMSTRSRKQIKKHFDRFKEEINTSQSGSPDRGMNFTINNKIPFNYKTFSSFKKFWNVKGVCGICNHKAVFDILIDDRALTFIPDKGITMEEIISFKISSYGNS